MPLRLLQFAAARTPQPGELFGELLPFLATLAGFIVVGWIVILMLRRSFRRSDRNDAGSFSLESLRRMHASGELSKEEFEQAKAAVLGQNLSMRSDTVSESGVTHRDDDQSSK